MWWLGGRSGVQSRRAAPAWWASCCCIQVTKPQPQTAAALGIPGYDVAARYGLWEAGQVEGGCGSRRAAPARWAGFRCIQLRHLASQAASEERAYKADREGAAKGSVLWQQGVKYNSDMN